MRRQSCCWTLLVFGATLWAASLAHAQLSFNPPELNFSANVGNQTLSQTMRISHPTPVTWNSMISGGPWLSLSPRSGTTDQDVSVTVNTAGLSASTYNGGIFFQANPPIGPTFFYPVRLVISAPPPTGGGLGVSQTRFDLVVAPGGSADFSFVVFEAASAVNEAAVLPSAEETSSSALVNWTAAVTLLNGSNWLTISPASGTATTQQSSVVTGRANAATLPGPGVYQALIVVTDTTTRRTVTVTVSLVVRSNDPRLALSQSAIVFFAAQGGPAPPTERLRVFNVGGGLANWTISGMPTWLTASPASGTATTNPAQISQTNLTAN
ncbi:MAG: BACON domain-containing protein, partial [Gammaproteobacteria bacterium]